MIAHPILIVAISLLLGYVVMDAALHKLRDPIYFAHIIDDYQLLPRATSGRLVIALGIVEASVATIVLLPASHRIGAALIFLLLTVYCAAISINLLRGRSTIECGCGGPAHRQELSPWLLLRNGLLIALSGALFLGTGGAVADGWLDWLVALFAAVVLILLYGIGNQLLRNQQRSPEPLL